MRFFTPLPFFFFLPFFSASCWCCSSTPPSACPASFPSPSPLAPRHASFLPWLISAWPWLQLLPTRPTAGNFEPVSSELSESKLELSPRSSDSEQPKGAGGKPPRTHSSRPQSCWLLSHPPAHTFQHLLVSHYPLLHRSTSGSSHQSKSRAVPAPSHPCSCSARTSTALPARRLDPPRNRVLISRNSPGAPRHSRHLGPPAFPDSQATAKAGKSAIFRWRLLPQSLSPKLLKDSMMTLTNLRTAPKLRYTQCSSTKPWPSSLILHFLFRTFATSPVSPCHFLVLEAVITRQSGTPPL